MSVEVELDEDNSVVMKKGVVSSGAVTPSMARNILEKKKEEAKTKSLESLTPEKQRSITTQAKLDQVKRVQKLL